MQVPIDVKVVVRSADAPAIWCIGLTIISVTAALLLVGIYDWRGAAVVGLWSMLVALAAMCFRAAFQLLRNGKFDIEGYARTIFFILLAAINLGAFNPLKGWLNRFGFWADPLLAEIDQIIFLGHDPWEMLTWASHALTAEYYSRAWFIVTLICVPLAAFWRRGAALATYFLIWGPLALIPQAMMQAGGPIFYERLGYGDRFSDLPYPDLVANYADYLWRLHSEGSFGMGSGISGMPSVHVMTATWVALLLFPTRARWAGVAFAVSILLLSVAIGWHYAVDGLFGAALVLAAYTMISKLLPDAAEPARFRQEG